MSDYEVGQRVKLTRSGRFDNSSGWASTAVGEEDVLIINRVGTWKALVRHELPQEDRSAGSFWVDNSLIVLTDAPEPRKLGEMPEGDHISIDDPRIAWIWEDAAKVASQEDYCAQYDRLADKLGAPGRVRNFRVKTVLNGINFTASIEARSRKEAQRLVDSKVGGSSTGEEG